MKIEYKNNKIRKLCTNAYEAEKKHGKEMAEKIQLRIDQISAAPTVELLMQYKIGRCHLLRGRRQRQYAMDLVHPYRLVFEKKEEEVQIASIMEIIDYH